MFELIMKIVFVLLAVLGIAELFRLLLFWMLRTENPNRFYLSLSVKGHDEEVEIALRSALERVRWMGRGEVQLVCIDSGMDEETRRICEVMSEEYPEIRFCTPSDLPEILCR